MGAPERVGFVGGVFDAGAAGQHGADMASGAGADLDDAGGLITKCSGRREMIDVGRGLRLEAGPAHPLFDVIIHVHSLALRPL
jgi:hypothetical protein